jgi:hypothetical protein
MNWLRRNKDYYYYYVHRFFFSKNIVAVKTFWFGVLYIVKMQRKYIGRGTRFMSSSDLASPPPPPQLSQYTLITLERLTTNTTVASVLGSIPVSSDTL